MTSTLHQPRRSLTTLSRRRRAALVEAPTSRLRVETQLQPIVDMRNGVTVAAEALSRFPGADGLTPDAVFAEARLDGTSVELEAACLRAALQARERLPHGMLLSVNLSPDVLTHPLVRDCWPWDLDGIIVEVTEHRASRPSELSDGLAELRSRGAAIAIDDVSTGYAGLLRLATLRPDYVKIDRQVVAGVRESAAQSAVLEALVGLSHRLDATVIGEGVEHVDDLATLAEFDVDYVQGFGVAEPSTDMTPISVQVTEACQAGRRGLLCQPAPSGHAAAHTRDMYRVTAALASAAEHADIHEAITRAARHLNIDVIGVSMISEDGHDLYEVAASGDDLDPHRYALAQLPATRRALDTFTNVEAHVQDPGSDSAERDILIRRGLASLLLLPLVLDDQPVGILELAHRTPRRWSSQDIAHSRGLAEHLSSTVLRLRPPVGVAV